MRCWINFRIGFWGVNILMGPNGPCSKLIYLVGTSYKGWIDSRLTFVHKGVLIIM